MLYDLNFICHHGIKGQRWGIRRFQNKDGSLTFEGRKRSGDGSVFISGSSKTQLKDSPYYRSSIPGSVKSKINAAIKENRTVLLGDCPGFDAQVQQYLAKKKYNKVELYVTGNEVRNNYGSKYGLNWKVNHIDGSKYEPGSKEWHAAKDIAMTNRASSGISVILENGMSKATRKNVDRLIDANKSVYIYELSKEKIKDAEKLVGEYLQEKEGL